MDWLHMYLSSSSISNTVILVFCFISLDITVLVGRRTFWRVWSLWVWSNDAEKNWKNCQSLEQAEGDDEKKDFEEWAKNENKILHDQML